MKQIRTVLTAVAILAVVGGALASKNFARKNVFCNDSQTHCTVLKDFTTTVVGTGNDNPCGTALVWGTTSTPSTACPTQPTGSLVYPVNPN